MVEEIEISRSHQGYVYADFVFLAPAHTLQSRWKTNPSN